MKLNKFAYLYSKPLVSHTLKIMKKIPGNLLKKTWKNHGNMEFCQSEKVGTLLTLLDRQVRAIDQNPHILGLGKLERFVQV